jgi:hypothetical protein
MKFKVGDLVRPKPDVPGSKFVGLTNDGELTTGIVVKVYDVPEISDPVQLSPQILHICWAGSTKNARRHYSGYLELVASSTWDG